MARVKIVIEELSKPHYGNIPGMIPDGLDDSALPPEQSPSEKAIVYRSNIPPDRMLKDIDESFIEKFVGGTSNAAGVIVIPSPDNIPNFYNPDGSANFSNTVVGEKNYQTVYTDKSSGYKYVTLSTLKNGVIRYYLPRSLVVSEIVISSTRKYTFHVNPNHITPSYRKIISEIRTRGGYEIQHWGNALSELKVQGHSGGLIDRGAQDDDITKTEAWRKLVELKTKYWNSNADPNTQSSILLSLTYYDTMYIGYFVDFTGPEANVNSPYIMDYSFTFKVTDEINL